MKGRMAILGILAWFSVGVAAMAASPTTQVERLNDRFTAPNSECRGWGRRETPWVLANSGAEPVQLANDLIAIPAGLTKENQLVAYELSNPAVGVNWIEDASVLPLADAATVNGAKTDLAWRFKEAAVDETKGRKVTIRFVCEQPALELMSVWQAQGGHGPVRHSIEISNLSSNNVTVAVPPSLSLWLRAAGSSVWRVKMRPPLPAEYPDPMLTYNVWSEDGSIAAAELTGQELMATGLAIRLPEPNSSDMVFIEEMK